MFQPNFTHLFAACITVATLTLIGCGNGDATNTNTETKTNTDTPAATQPAASLPSDLLLASPPGEPQPIPALKESAAEGDEVIVKVVVGGRVDPIVEGRASAAIIDAELENICLADDDHCPTPWDYCCAGPEARQTNLATLQVLNEDGRVLAAEFPDHIKPLSTLIVRGTVGPRPAPEVLTINADGIFVVPDGG